MEQDIQLQIAKAQKIRSRAVIILVVVVILGSFVGCLRSINAQQTAVLKEFNRDVGIATDLQTRFERSYDLVTVAYRYLDTADPAITALLQARNDLENAKTTQEKYQANLRLTEAAVALNNKLQALDLSSKDEGYRSAIMAELESRNATISHDAYNDLARRYNEKVLGAFPASLLASALGVEELAVFR